MPDEGTEQVVADPIGADEAAAGAPEGVADAVVEDVAGAGEPVAATVVTFDLSTPEAIRAEAERNAALRAWREEGYGAGLEAGRQKALREQQDKASSREEVDKFYRSVVSRLSAGEEPAEVMKDAPTFVVASQTRAWLDSYRALLRAAGELGDETAAGLAEELTGTPEEAMKVAQVTLDAVAKRARADERSSTLASLTFDALPDDHPLRSYLRDQIAAGVKAEVQAREMEAARAAAVNPPNVQGFGPGSISTLDPDRERLMREGIPMTDEAARKRVAAALGVSL